MGKYDLTGVREPSHGEEAAEAPQPAARAAAAIRPAAAPAVREPGKRSNPDFSRTTVYMRDTTKLKAVRLLQDRKEDRDLSDLIESLVSTWTAKHTNT